MRSLNCPSLLLLQLVYSKTKKSSSTGRMFSNKIALVCAWAHSKDSCYKGSKFFKNSDTLFVFLQNIKKC